MKASLGLISGRLIPVGERSQLYRVMPAIQVTDAQLAEWFGLQESDWEAFVSETLLWILAVEPALVAGPRANPALFAAAIEKLIRAFPNEFRTLHVNQPHLNEKDVAHTHLESRTKYLCVRKNKDVYEELKQMARHSKYIATVQTRSMKASRATRGILAKKKICTICARHSECT